MHGTLDMLQVRDDRERHEYQQRPGAPLRDMDGGPRPELMRIGPKPEEGADVLGEPDEESRQDQTERERHAPVAPVRAEDDPRPRVSYFKKDQRTASFCGDRGRDQRRETFRAESIGPHGAQRTYQRQPLRTRWPRHVRAPRTWL